MNCLLSCGAPGPKSSLWVKQQRGRLWLGLWIIQSLLQGQAVFWGSWSVTELRRGMQPSCSMGEAPRGTHPPEMPLSGSLQSTSYMMWVTPHWRSPNVTSAAEDSCRDPEGANHPQQGDGTITWNADPKRDDQRRTTRTRPVKPLSGHRLRNWAKWEHLDCKNLKLWQQKTATPPHRCITALNVVTLLICFIETCLWPSDVPQRIFIL